MFFHKPKQTKTTTKHAFFSSRLIRKSEVLSPGILEKILFELLWRWQYCSQFVPAWSRGKSQILALDAQTCFLSAIRDCTFLCVVAKCDHCILSPFSAGSAHQQLTSTISHHRLLVMAHTRSFSSPACAPRYSLCFVGISISFQVSAENIPFTCAS